MSVPAMLWDQHACLPLDPDADVGELRRLAAPGGTYVSVNVGYSPHGTVQSLDLLAGFHDSIASHPHLVWTPTVAEIRAAVGAGLTAVGFDLEDSGPLGGDLTMVRTFAELGVRTLLPSYNHANDAGGGCLDATDTGLTAWGRDLVAEMNAVGMVVDGSHCGARTGLDLCEQSARPVVYSHSCLQSVWEHPRNITDDQARACAATGGVVGITGVGIFLGPNTPTVDALIRHLETAVELIGVEHVGLSSDFSFDHDQFNREITANPTLFDQSYTRWGPIRWMAPEVFVGVGEALAFRGWADHEVAAVLGGNFLRVADEAWPAGTAPGL